MDSYQCAAFFFSTVEFASPLSGKLETETQGEAGNEWVELVGGLLEAAASGRHLTNHGVRVCDIEEICNWFQCKSVVKMGRARESQVENIDVRQTYVSNLFTDDGNLALIKTRDDCSGRPIVRIKRIACVMLKVDTNAERFRK